MILTTTFDIPNRQYEILDIVQGSTVQSKHLGRDITASLKTIVGGELKSYSVMLEESREIAKSRMVEQAKKLDADAIIGINFSSSAIMAGASEMLAYGTAIKFI